MRDVKVTSVFIDPRVAGCDGQPPARVVALIRALIGAQVQRADAGVPQQPVRGFDGDLLTASTAEALGCVGVGVTR